MTHTLKFTPAPWSARKSVYGTYNITTAQVPRTYNIAHINDDRAEHEANAHLIAASPRMYEYIDIRARHGDKEAIKIIEEINNA